MTNSRLTDPEVLEWRFPVLLEDFAIRHGSGGKGKHSGGDGVIRRLHFLEAMSAAILSGHRRIPPYGMAEGEGGACGKNLVKRVDGSKVALAETGQVDVTSGDAFTIETPGDGGFGKD
jgi:5-oxoprolinase (ATP-hydrolysing)